MSELSTEQLQLLEKRLLELKDQMTGGLRSMSEQARPGESSQQTQDMARTQRRRDEAQFMLVSGALGRMRQGTYGECLRCEEPIGFERLAANPETSLCLTCRQTTERR